MPSHQGSKCKNFLQVHFIGKTKLHGGAQLFQPKLNSYVYHIYNRFTSHILVHSYPLAVHYLDAQKILINYIWTQALSLEIVGLSKSDKARLLILRKSLDQQKIFMRTDIYSQNILTLLHFEHKLLQTYCRFCRQVLQVNFVDNHVTGVTTINMIIVEVRIVSG